MSSQTYPPQKLATVELLTQEIDFRNAPKIVAQINHYHEKNTKYDAEYYDTFGVPSENQKTLSAVMEILDEHLQRVASMEFHALVRHPDEAQAIPRIGDAILFKHSLLNALTVIKDLIKHKHAITDPDANCYLEHFIQRWIYKFCRHIFSWEDPQTQLMALFAPELKKGKDGFEGLVMLFIHITDLHLAPNPAEIGYNPSNLRRFYVVFSNLLMICLQQGILIPFNLQRIFVEFHKNDFFNYADFEEKAAPIQAERHCLLIDPKAIQPFFLQLKSVNTLMKRAVLFGMMIEPERKFAMGYFCDLGIKGVADLYQFIGHKLESEKLSRTEGKNWLYYAYQTITEVVAEKKIVENPEIPEEIRAAFGSPKTFAAPSLEEEESLEEESRAPAEAPKEPPKEAIDLVPKTFNIPNLVPADGLVELQDRGTAKKIMIVQDANVLDLIVKNWEIRGSLTFPELIEFARIPFQVLQRQRPGIREGRKFVSFAYLIALGLQEKHISEFVEKLAKTGQITPERASQLHRLYPFAVEQIGALGELNKDTRPLFSAQGLILPDIFIEKCNALQAIFMEKYSYIQSLLEYWMLVEEMFYGIAKTTAVLGNIIPPTPKKIEEFVASQNEEYMAVYEKALNFVGLLKVYFKKKYNAELQQQFVNVKIKNDLLTFAKTTPVDLAKRS